MQRNIAIDSLKLLLAAMVVALHAGFLGEESPVLAYLFDNGLFRVAVPVFLVINGFYFFDAIKSKQTGKWLKRVVILYFVWMALYAPLWLPVDGPALSWTVKFFRNIAFGFHHLWYLAGMLGAAIACILLHQIRSSFFIGICIMLFMIGVLIQYTGNYHVFEGTYLDQLFNYHWSHRNALFFSLPFFSAGYLIRKHSLHKAVPIKALVWISIISLLTLLTESYVNYMHPSRDGGFDNLISLLICCPAIFLLFQNITIVGKTKGLALYSSAIYFVHPLALYLLTNAFGITSTSLAAAGLLLSIVFSIFLVRIKRRIPWII